MNKIDTRPYIFLIIIDTLRKDYSKPLGEILLRKGFRPLNNAIAPAPWTLPSHASMFTGLYPRLHGGHETIRGDIETIKHGVLLTSKLSRIGYRNIDLTANPIITSAFGFNGFHVIYEYPLTPINITFSTKDYSILKKIRRTAKSRTKYLYMLIRNKHYGLALKLILRYFLDKSKINSIPMILARKHREKGSKKIIEDLDKILERQRDKPLFVFINFMEVHEPYTLRELFSLNKVSKTLIEKGKVSQEIIDEWRKNYPLQVKRISSRIERLIDLLERHGVYEDSLIIVTSDHGQLLGEYYGVVGHTTFLFDELLHVPFYIKYPSRLSIKYVEEYSGKWFSLTKIPELVVSVVETFQNNRAFFEETILANKVYAEAFGAHMPFIQRCIEGGIKCGFTKYLGERIAIYMNNYKLVLNISKKTIEENKDYGGGEIGSNIREQLLREILNYLSFVERVKKLRIKTR